MTDIRETERLLAAIDRLQRGEHTFGDQAIVICAAQRGAKARDAALEEAARVAEAVDPEKPANWLHARHKIAFAIRALRRPG